MARPQAEHIIVIGAGAAGLMAARELALAGRRVTILEARERCGGRILPLAPAEFGYRAEGGAEYVHGEAPVTHGLLREAGLDVLPIEGARWNVEQGRFSPDDRSDRGIGLFYERLAELRSDITVTDFLKKHFAGPEHDRLRHFVIRMVEGYDAADPSRASMLALRDEWTDSGRSQQARIKGGYGALIDFLAADCVRLGADLHLGAAVSAVETAGQRAMIRCANGAAHTGDVAVVAVPLPLLGAINFPAAVRKRTAAAAEIGFGNVIKFLLRFRTRWWIDAAGKNLSELLFLISDKTVPVWWTQRPTDHPVLTGWLAGPRTNAMADLDESALIALGLSSLADIFAIPREQLARDLVAARAINWAADPFARGGYSYVTLATRAAQAALAGAQDGVVFSGEALYRGPEMGTVEAALASGLEAARTILAADGVVRS